MLTYSSAIYDTKALLKSYYFDTFPAETAIS